MGTRNWTKKQKIEQGKAMRKAWRRRKENLALQKTIDNLQEELAPAPTPARKDKSILTLFILFFPSVLIAAILDIPFYALVLKGLLCLYQIVLIKNFVDDYYER